jgi:murein L,D-transpeptidase YafK
MEGDRCTPEGWFTIRSKRPSSKYNKFLEISYPNDSALVRFNHLKATGALPETARIGGDIGIHGIWKGGEDMIELCVGWTDGCIALKNSDVDELYSLIGVGTRVYIRK